MHNVQFKSHLQVNWSQDLKLLLHFSSNQPTPDLYNYGLYLHPSAKNISVQVEWPHLSGHASSEPSETPRWQMTPWLASIQRVTFHVALWWLFHCFFSFCRSPISNGHSGVVANRDHTSEWFHWARACIGISMRWVTLQKSLLGFLQPVRTMQFSCY